MQFVIVCSDGTVRRDALTTTDDELDRFQGHVGGYIQRLPLDGFDVYVNDEGLIEDLPRNSLAESLFGWPEALHGNAVVTGGADHNGDTVGLSEEQMQQLRTALTAHGVSIDDTTP